MTLKTYSRFDLAKNQLKTAIGLFVSGGDRFSVITLAGAAVVILSRLVTDRGQENFTDISMCHETERGGQPGTRPVYDKGMNYTLFINQIKHMDDDGFIDLDAVGSSLATFRRKNGPEKQDRRESSKEFGARTEIFLEVET